MQPVMRWRLIAFHTFSSEDRLPLFNGSTSLQGVLREMKAAAKSSFTQFTPMTTKALAIFCGTAYVQSCMHERRLHGKLYRKAESRTGEPAQVVTRARTLLLKLIGIENF